LAGAESQLMSLWQVSDDGTRELTVEYYRRLPGGRRTPSEALQQVQLGMLKTPRRSHPFYWSSFIQSAEWKNLKGKDAAAK
jgi:CHAT domain-containing protein